MSTDLRWWFSIEYRLSFGCVVFPLFSILFIYFFFYFFFFLFIYLFFFFSLEFCFFFSCVCVWFVLAVIAHLDRFRLVLQDVRVVVLLQILQILTGCLCHLFLLLLLALFE